MAANISDKFRIFNAKQFLESLSEGPSETSEERSRMYFFVGRPQAWDAYIEIYSRGATNFTVDEEVYIGGTYATASFKAKVRAVYENSLILYDVLPATAAPAAGSTLVGWNGTANTATALTGVYRFATEDIPPVPLDNLHEEVMQFIENNKLMGKGLGYIDVHLIASAVLTNISLSTLDKTLAEVSSRLRIGFHA